MYSNPLILSSKSLDEVSQLLLQLSQISDKIEKCKVSHISPLSLSSLPSTSGLGGGGSGEKEDMVAMMLRTSMGEHTDRFEIRPFNPTLSLSELSRIFKLPSLALRDSKSGMERNPQCSIDETIKARSPSKLYGTRRKLFIDGKKLKVRKVKGKRTLKADSDEIPLTQNVFDFRRANDSQRNRMIERLSKEEVEGLL